MESVKIASGISGHGPPMLYQGRQPSSAHPNPPSIIRPTTTRSYEGSTYKETISPPLVSRSGYASFGHMDSAHQGVAARYLHQPHSGYLPYASREAHYARPLTDRPSLLMPHPSRRPSIMGTYGGYNTKDLMQQLITTSNMPVNASNDSFKRMKLSQGMRADAIFPPLVVETPENHTSRESSYYPQVEAISPTLPPDPRDESPLHSTQDDLLKQIEQVDKDIMLIESSIANLRKKEETLKAAAQKGDSQSQQEVEDVKEPKHQSTAQIIYAENRAKAEDSHFEVGKNLCSQEERSRVLPHYNQPADCSIYQENKKKFNEFKCVLMKHFKRTQESRASAEHKLTHTYNKLMASWLRRVDKIENSKKQKEKSAKSRDLFEKVFPELRKQREEKERFTRVGARVKSDAEMEEIMDGLQEQENEDKKMRAYAVIPPILLDERQRRYQFINKNGLLATPLEDYKEQKNINIWTEHECEMFKEKYLQHPKNFVVIASYLEKKSVSDCIQHYYLTKKKENYKLLVKRRMRRPRTKAAAQNHMEAIHLNARVRTRGSAQKELLKTDVSSSSASSSSQPNTITTTTTTSSIPTSGQDIATNGPITSQNDPWPEPMDTHPIQANGPHKSLPNAVITNATSINNDLREMDKENLSNCDKSQRRKEEKSKGDIDSSDEEQSDGAVCDCVVCKTRVTRSRPLKPGTASQYGLNEEDVPDNARVCSNCRCRAVRRTRQYVCQIATCKTSKYKIKRLRPFPPRWASLPASIRDPVIKELEIPPDVTKSCQVCHNRIVRKLGAEAEEPVDASTWTTSDIQSLRQALRELGCHWSKVAEKMPNKTSGEIRSFYTSFKQKHKFDEAVSEYKKIKGKSDPPTVTDEEESGSSASSADEAGSLQPPLNPPSQVRHDSASDTLSASSPPPPISSLEEKEVTMMREPTATSVPGAPTREDYDSSATTVSADEGPSGIERDSPPEVEVIPHPGEKRLSSSTANRARSAQFNNTPQPAAEGAVFQDIISKTISASLPDSDKAHAAGREITMETLLQPVPASTEASGLPPPAGMPVQYPQYMNQAAQDDGEEVQRECLDLTVKKRDRSPPHRPNSESSAHVNSQMGRKDMPPITVRGGAEVTLAEKGSPPKAHSNSVSYTCYSMPERYYPNDYRKSPVFLSDSRSLPPQNSTGIISREPSPLGYTGRNQSTTKPSKSVMAPPPITVSSPVQICNLTQNSSRRPPPKVDKNSTTIHGSITLGTPVNQPPHPSASMSHPSRYDFMAKTLAGAHREGGSITQGTPVHHDPKRASVPQGHHSKDNAMFDQTSVDIVPRQSHEILSAESYRSQRGQPLPGHPTAGYPGFPNYPSYQQRSSYSDSQITSREIIKNDYLTSQQMPGRRPTEKDHPPVPRGREPSPQGNVKDARIYPVHDRRGVEGIPSMIDPRADRRPDQRKDLNNLEYRGLDGRSVISDRDKSRQYVRTSSGLVSAHYYQPVNIRNHPGDYRTGARVLSSPASTREATPTPPSSEQSHDYRTSMAGHPLPSHSRVNTVIQTANKLPVSSAIRNETGRHSPHTSVMQSAADFVAASRRDAKQIEGLGSVMIGNRHMYDPRPSSREKTVHQVIAEDKRYREVERRERPPYKEEDPGEKLAMNKYGIDLKAMQNPKARPDGFEVKNLVDCIIRKSIHRGDDPRDGRSYRREDPPTSHGYPLVSESDKRVRSPAFYHHKEKEIGSVKEGSDMNSSHRSQIHKDAHASSLHPSLVSHYGNIMKGQHIDSLMARDIQAGIDLKKISSSNHHPYSRPSLEITRTDARPSHLSQSDQGKMQTSSSMLYPVDVDSKEGYESKSPHRLATSTPTSHHRDHMGKDERQIFRIAQSAQQAHSENINQNINPFDFMKNKIQQIWREDSPEKERRAQENSRRSGPPPVHRSMRLPQQSSSAHITNMGPASASSPQQQQQQTIRSNSHFEDEHVKKRPRLDLPTEVQGQRPPSKPVNSGSESKEYQREDDADSPQSGEMVIDETPNRDPHRDPHNLIKVNSGPPSTQAEGMDKQERSKAYAYANVYRGYPSHSAGGSLPPHSSWSVVTPAPSKNGGFQGYEPSVEPVSDDE